MKCSRCGNEVNPEEAFCGQCGAPMRQPAAPTEMINTPSPRPAYPGTYQTTGRPNAPDAPSASFPPSSSVYQRGMPPGAATGATNMPYGSTQSPFPRTTTNMAGPGQQSDFYQDATEAMSSLPSGSPNYPTAATGYPQGQQSFIGTGQPNGQNMYGTATPSPYMTGRLNPQQGYGSGPTYDNTHSTIMPPRSQPNNTLLIVAIMCLVLVLISVVALGTYFVLKSHNNTAGPNSNNGATVINTPSTTPSPTATVAPSPTPSVTTSPTPSATATGTPTTPTPVASPTPAPDPGFSWCGTVCTNNNFTVEYPQGWQPGPATNAPGMQFTDPNEADIYASFKALGASQSTASTIAMSDLQTNYASQAGYAVTQPGSTATISGETWFTATATYQLNGQTERVIVYAIIHQGNAYIIELQAPDNQFDTINVQYFNVMLGKYQFLQ